MLDSELYEGFRSAKIARRLFRVHKYSSNGDQKNLFLGNEIENPVHVYEIPAKESIKEDRSYLEDLARSAAFRSRGDNFEGLICDSYQALISQAIDSLDVMAEGFTGDNDDFNPEHFLAANVKRYGELSHDLWLEAIDYLSTKDTPNPYRLTSGITDILVKSLEMEEVAVGGKCGIDSYSGFKSLFLNLGDAYGWELETGSSQTYMSLNYNTRILTLPEASRTWSKRKWKKVAVHELGVHMGRWVNMQGSLRLLEFGLQGYRAFEEGLAVLLAAAIVDEKSVKGIISYAGLGLALGYDGTPKDFRGTFEALEKLLVTRYSPVYARKRAYDTTKRIFKGSSSVAAGAVNLSDKQYLEGIKAVIHTFDAATDATEVAKMAKYRYNPANKSQSALIELLIDRKILN